jgi:hypothetical protein
MEYFRDILIGSMALLGGAVTLGTICYAINDWVQNRYGRKLLAKVRAEHTEMLRQMFVASMREHIEFQRALALELRKSDRRKY